MIDQLIALSTALTEPDMTVARASALIGTPQPRTESLAPWGVTPREAGFTDAEVVGDAEDAAPAYVRLTVADAAHLSVDDLRKPFGEPKKLPRSRPHQGDRWMFRVRRTGAPFECAVIAETAEAGSKSVRTLTLRRDQVLAR